LLFNESKVRRIGKGESKFFLQDGIERSIYRIASTYRGQVVVKRRFCSLTQGNRLCVGILDRCDNFVSG
jgi:hypothetical protein